MGINDKFRIRFDSNGVYIVAPKNKIENLTLDVDVMKLRNAYAELNPINSALKSEIFASGDYRLINSFFSSYGGGIFTYE